MNDEDESERVVSASSIGKGKQMVNGVSNGFKRRVKEFLHFKII